jgi:stage IV sporulation protein FB
MVRFTLFGIPVEIQPWFWLSAAFFGGLMDLKTPDDMKYTLMFMFASTISILVHEFGHALTGRRLAGGQPNIVLWAFGGLAYNRGARFTRWQDFWMTFMGPGAGFLLFGAVALAMVLSFGAADAGILIGNSLFNLAKPVSRETWEFFQSHKPLSWMMHGFLWINFWWGMVNLLPVPPLDGGQIADIFVQPKSKLYTIAIVTGVAMAIVGLVVMKSLYVALLFGYLAFRNYQSLQNLLGHRR